ncbi:MAG: hypothetical protein QM500_19980 [Methylococcales bacterium]
MSNSTILSSLQVLFPDCWFKPGCEFDGSDARIAWSGEGSLIDGISAFDSSSFETDPSELQYTMFVHNKLATYVAEQGYYWESYDSGTFFLYKI